MFYSGRCAALESGTAACAVW